MQMMHPDDIDAARQRYRALIAYRYALEYIALLDFLHPEADKAKIIRAAQCILNEHPCDITTADE